jgi:hypothetical protein
MSEQRYASFLKVVEPTMVGLNSANVVLDREAFWKAMSNDDSRLLVSRELKSRCSLGETHDDAFDAEGSFALRVTERGREEPLLLIECVIAAHLHAPVDSMDREHAKRFAESEAGVLLWPYFREFVTNVTGRMAIPPMTVPLLLTRTDSEGDTQSDRNTLSKSAPKRTTKERSRRRK